MPLYEVTQEGLQQHNATAFAKLGMYERGDLQRLLRDDISVLGEDLLVISEEFGEWEDAKRRIDLLAIDRTGRLVVIEIKRTDSGGHMELQAIRYAAMVSSMTFPELVATYERHCAKQEARDTDARAELEAFLDVGEDMDEPVVSSDVRILLVAADFGREITTTVLWLDRFEGMDVRCVRLIPYDIGGKILLDIQQVLPLPEAADYQVKVRRKEAARDRARTDAREFTRYEIIVDGQPLPDENKRNSMRLMVQQLLAHGISIAEIHQVLPGSRLRVLEGEFPDASSVEAALQAAYPNSSPRRWFCDSPFLDTTAGQTYLLSKMWGRATEPRMNALVEAFPAAGVTFRVLPPVEE